MKYVIVREWWGGLSRSSSYYFVIEGNRLVHISRYAKEVEVDRRGGRAEYAINLSDLKGLKVLKISASNKGIFCNAFLYEPEELVKEFLERRYEIKPLSIINSLKIEHLIDEERFFLNREWNNYYLPMINRIRGILQPVRERVGYLEITDLLRCQIFGGVDLPLSYLIPYSEVARRKSLEGLTKEIHQIWVTVEIVAALERRGKLVGFWPVFKQSPYNATITFTCTAGTCSLWYEFDINPLTLCEGMLWYGFVPEVLEAILARARSVYRGRRLERMPLRPDLVVIEGADTCEGLKRGFKVKAIIECKNQEYMYWARTVENQVLPYKEVFRPDYTIIASLMPVSESAKIKAARYGIILIDEVNPKGEGIDRLVEIIDSL
jgi:hypothetical protein